MRLNQAAANDTRHAHTSSKVQEKSLPLKGSPYKPHRGRLGQVIFRGTRAFLRGNSAEFVESKGIRYGAEVAVLKLRGGGEPRIPLGD